MMEVWLTISVVVLATAVAALAYAVIQDRKVPRTLVIQRPLPPQHTASGREPEPTNVPPLASIALESGLGRVMEISIATDRQSRKLAESTPVNSALFRNALATLPSVLPSLVLSQQIAGT